MVSLEFMATDGGIVVLVVLEMECCMFRRGGVILEACGWKFVGGSVDFIGPLMV